MQRGFTLMELLVTVTVAAVALATGVPGFRNLISDNRLATQANLLVGSFLIARSEAVKRGEEATVCSANAQHSACGSGDDWGNGWLVMVGNEVIRELPPLEGRNRLAGTSDVADAVAFNSLGVPAAMGGFWLCDGTFEGRARYIEINAIGRIRVTRYDDAASCA